ncbi:MAG: NAD(P)/FAD-dependent oxidoreductase [Candidatus Coprovivens sp.]
MKKVVIIGGGPAGLTAAYELLKSSKDFEVVILEEQKQVGGISKTIKYKGNRMDLGGHRFFSKSEKVNDFWNEIMPLQGKPSFDDKKLKRKKKLSKNGPDPEKENNVMLIRERVSRIYYLKKFFDYPISLKLETLKNMGFVRTMQSGFSYLKSLLIKKREDSLENFYINRFGKKLYSMFFEGYTEKLWGRHPKEISADWGAQRVKGISIIAVLKDAFNKLFHIKSKKQETSLIEEYYYPKFGPGQLWEQVAKEIEKMGGKVLLNYRVEKIKIEKNKVESLTCVVGDKEEIVEGDIFISSMPIKDLINGMNKVPLNISKIANGLPYRDFVTVGLLVKKLNLKNETDKKTLNNIVPDCWIYVQENDVKMGRIQVFNNWSPYMVKNPMDTVWIGLEYFCNENDDFWNLSEKDTVKFAVNELVSMGIIDKDDVLDSHREQVKKAYPAYFDTYSEIDKVISYLNKFDNLYCIGRNGQHRYNNMDHSMMTAFETVDVILGNKSDKNVIWNVNVEKEYHEEK